MSESVLLVEKKDGIATLTLNRPDQLNALSMELRQRLVQEIDSIRTDKPLTDLQAMAGLITDPDIVGDNVMFSNGYMQSPGLRIAGGTDEIMLNIIAERVLSLPQDIRVDKEVSFNQLPTGGA